MQVEFLGAGGAITTPRPACTCRVCAEAREKGVPYSRTGPSLFVHGPDVLIDTPGGIEKGDLRRVVEVSDLVVIPLSLSPTDIRSSAETAGLVGAPDKTRLLFNQVNVRTNTAWRSRRSRARCAGACA